MSILIKSLIQTAVFMICARAMVQLRPKGDYEKYLKLLVSLMILSQITFALTGLWKGGGEQEKQLEALERQLIENLSNADSLTGEAQRKVEALTMGQIRDALAQEEKKKQEGQDTESEQGDAKIQVEAQKQEGQKMAEKKEKTEEQQLSEVQMAEEQAAKQEETPLQKQPQTEQQSKNKEEQAQITIKIEPIKVGEEP